MPVGVIRPDQADDFDAWFSVTQASYRHEFPGEPGWFHDERRAMALDVAAGKKAGFKTVAVGTGYSEWKELVASKPDHLARDFRGLGKWLTWFELN